MKVSSFQLWTPKGREPTAAGVQNKKFWILKAHSCIAIATVIFSFLPQPISCMKFSLSAIATTVLNPIQPLYFDKKFIRTCNLLGVKYCVNCLLNNGLYYTKGAHSYLLFGQFLPGLKS